jgi:hypothetical protein
LSEIILFNNGDTNTNKKVKKKKEKDRKVGKSRRIQDIINN